MRIKDWIRSVLKKQALHQTAFVVTGSFVNGVSLFILNIVLARALDQELFGIFSLAILVLSTVGELSDFGLNSALLRFAPYYIATNQADKLKQLLKTIWRWRISLTAILTIGGIILSYPLAKYLFGQEKIAPYLTFSFVGVGGVILLGFLATFLQSKQRFFYHASLQSLKGLLRLGTVAVFMLFGVTNLYAYLSAYIFVPWLLFLTNFGVFPEKFREATVDEEIRKNLHAQLAAFSFWLTVASFTSIIAGKINQVMISHYLGLREVAIFAVAIQLIQVFPILYGSISSVLMPKVSSLADKAALIVFAKRIFKWVLVGSIGVGLFIYPSQYLIELLFGQKYVEAMPVYLFLAFSTLFNIISIPFSLTIIVFNRTHIAALAGVVHMIFNILCNLVLIPRFGLMGAAYTYAAGMVVQLVWDFSWVVYLVKTKELKKL